MIAKFHMAFAAGLVAATISLSAQAQVQQMGATPKAEDLIKALTPSADTGSSDSGSLPGPLNVRGIRVLNSTPGSASTTAATHPSAVALDVKFALGSADLTDAARQTIGQLAKAIKSDQLQPYKFKVEGHTDNTGKADANLVLSQKRAEAVKAYLVENYGITPDRLDAIGRGQEEPLDRAHPDSGVNRRVQVAIEGAK